MRAAAVAAVALILAGVAVALSSSAPRLAGSNDFRAGLALVVPPGERLCQGPELLPADAAEARLVAGADARLAIEARDGGRVLATGRGDPSIPLSEPTEAAFVDEICIRNRGTEPVALGGQALPPEQAATVDGEAAAGRARIEWFRAGEESWYELAPTIVHRFGFGRADWLGSWALFLAGALVLGSWVAALRLIAWGRGR